MSYDFLRDPERDITRAELAHVLARTLPESIFQEEDHRRRSANDQVLAASMANLRYLPDLTEDTPYLEDILWLYRWGIAAGSDERGAFLPNQPVSRSEAAALMTEMRRSPRESIRAISASIWVRSPAEGAE